MKRAHSAALPIACRTRRGCQGTPSRTTSRARWRSRLRMLAALASACVMAALLAACGGSSSGPAGGSAAPSPAGPTPQPSPQITAGTPPGAAVAVVRRYWTLLSGHDFDAAFALTTGPHVAKGSLRTTGVDSARYLRPVGDVFPSPGDDATIDFGSQVLIVPTATGSPFGTEPRRWLMFSRVVRMSDGSWRLVELGTGP
jgi:hypothetical protein